MNTTADALARTLAEHDPSAGVWEALQVPALSRTGLIDALIGAERLLAHIQALEIRLLAALAGARDPDAFDCTEEEVTAALRWSYNTARNRLDEAQTLATQFPETLALLAVGQVCRPQVTALLEITTGLEPQAARAAQERVLPRMPRQSTAATRKALHRAVLAVDPLAADKRHAGEREQRRVVLYPEPDGMSTLALYTPAETGAAVMAALDVRARPHTQDDARSLDQRRADTLTDLVLASAVQPGGTTQTRPEVPALVHVVVGVDTLLGSDEEPAQLRGFGPISAGQARTVAFGRDAVWRRLLTAPDGELLHVDAHTYRPTASVQRLVRLRDQHCTFPGCTRPAARCDLDHITAFNHHQPENGGASVPENLHALCRRHHRLKTAGTWTVTRENDEILWSAPTGHQYTTRPESYAA